MIDESFWNEVILTGGIDAEFDWYGIDQHGFIGAFSTYNRGFIPERVKFSYQDYRRIFEAVNQMPSIHEAELITKGDGRYDDWMEYARKGLLAFDYSEIHGATTIPQYNLLARPRALLTGNELGLSAEIISLMPRLSLSFDVVSGIEEQLMKDTGKSFSNE